jgi:hypothetical protein
MSAPVAYVVRCTTKSGHLYWGGGSFKAKVLCQRYECHDAALEVASQALRYVPDNSAKGTVRVIGLRARVST